MAGGCNADFVLTCFGIDQTHHSQFRAVAVHSHGGRCDKASSSFLKPVTFSFKRQQRRAVHQPIQNGRAHRVVAQVFAPVFYDSVGGHQDGAAQFVASVNYRLE